MLGKTIKEEIPYLRRSFPTEVSVNSKLHELVIQVYVQKTTRTIFSVLTANDSDKHLEIHLQGEFFVLLASI